MSLTDTTLNPANMQALVVGTGHVTREEAALLDTGRSPGENLADPMVWQYGWMIYIGNEGDVVLDGLSEGLRGVIEWAWDAGYQWVRFDCDHDHIEGIETYDW